MEDENKNELPEETSEDGEGSSGSYDVVEEVEIVKQMKDAFLDYSMSVIVQRALPDVRDGMKPVHRRILYAMANMNMTPGSAHKKSARIVGDVIGKYHPHGDTAVYDAMVRMAQDFSYRYPLVDGHGNFGSLDGDGAAAMRYTEARMSKISMEMVANLNKDTVDFIETYDGDGQEPLVLPSRIPNLLLNGAMGIAVGMATNIPTHNLSETVAAIKAVMNDPQISIPELMDFLPGPDFPTGGIIIGRKGIRDAYETGRGSITIRSRYRVEDLPNGKKRIIYYEIPYGVNKMKLFEKMADVVRNKQVQGITYLNDESNRDGVRIVMDLKKDAQEDVIINQMFRLTPLQSTMGINMLALENDRPKQLSIKEIIIDYILHQEEVVTRATQFDLRKAEERLHIVEGLRIALDHLDELIHMIRSSHDEEPVLIQKMNETFGLDEIQSKAILAMQIRRLSGLEREKIEDEYNQLLAQIADYKDILANKSRILAIIRDNLDDIDKKYGDARRTEIIEGSFDVIDEDLIPTENIVLTLTDSGYVKAQPTDTYHIQNRGGKGIRSISLNEEDTINRMFTLSNHDNVLVFTTTGRVYRLKGYQFPMGSRTSKGVPIVNLLTLQDGEKVQTMLAYNDDDKAESLFFVTEQGIVKKTPVEEFKNINRNGKIAIKLNDNDSLAFVKGIHGDEDILIGGSNGKVIRFKADEVRSMGRTAAGVKGFNTDGGKVIGAAVSSEGNTIFTVSEKGFGKRSLLSDYRLTNRGSKGVLTINVTEKTGNLVAMKAVNGDEDAMIVTDTGNMIRIHLHNIGVYGRNTQGLKLLRPGENDKVNRVTITEHLEADLDENETENKDLKAVESELIQDLQEAKEDEQKQEQKAQPSSQEAESKDETSVKEKEEALV